MVGEGRGKRGEREEACGTCTRGVLGGEKGMSNILKEGRAREGVVGEEVGTWRRVVAQLRSGGVKSGMRGGLES